MNGFQVYMEAGFSPEGEDDIYLSGLTSRPTTAQREDYHMKPSKLEQRVQELRLVFGAKTFGHCVGRNAFAHRLTNMDLDREAWSYTWRVHLPTRTLNAGVRAGLIEILPIGYEDHRGGRYRLTIEALSKKGGCLTDTPAWEAFKLHREQEQASRAAWAKMLTGD
jgi:hypothetical protein